MHLQIFFFVPDPPPPITIPGVSDCGSALPVKSFVKTACNLVPKGHDPLGQNQGSLTSERIRRKISDFMIVR